MRSDDEAFEFDSEDDEIEMEFDTDYHEEYDEDEISLWDDEEDSTDTDTDEPPVRKRRKRKKEIAFDDTENADAELSEQAKRQFLKEQQLIDELEADAEENPIEDDKPDEDSERKKLKRELQAEALARLEDAARTVSDFEKVVAWWDKLDANRERRERYHELSRSGDDLPLDYGAAKDGLFFPDTLNNVLEKLIRKGDFIDAIFYCPYDIHELVTEENLSDILRDLSEDHKELLFLCAVRLFSSTRIAAIRGQTDRNIRKVRVTMLKKIRKKLFPALLEKAKKQQPLTLLEKDFVADNSAEVDYEKKK